jgi:hypothetical protein
MMQCEGLTQPQFAAALGVSPTTVKRALARAVRDRGHEALVIDGNVGGHGFSARRRVARGGEPWRFALVDGSAALRATPERRIERTDRPSATPPDLAAAEQSTVEQIAWLRTEIEHRNAALEREQLANAELRRLLLSNFAAAQPAAASGPDATAQQALLVAAERAAHETGIGKKQRRELLTRLAALLNEHA